MIIEVIGPAGSGKTTFVKNIYKADKSFDNGEIAAFRGLLHCPEVKLHFRTLLRLIPPRVAFKLRLTRITHFYRDQLLRSQVVRGLEPYLSHTLNAINNADLTNAEKFWLADKCVGNIADYVLLNQPVNKDRLIFIDEFLVQKILSLYYIHKSTADIEAEEVKYLELVPKPRAIVFLNTDLDIAFTRVRRRRKGRPHVLKNQSDEEFITTNKKFKDLEENVCNYLEDKYQVQKIEASNNTGLDATFREIVRLFIK
jgi:hypothetical protein